MKKRFNILTAISACLIFSVLPGCGCGQEQEVMETVSTLEETEIESESVSSEETTEEETLPEETTMEQTESTEEQSETVIETEGIEIQDMSAVMYTTANVVLRQEPSTESEKLRTVSAGEEVEVTGQTIDDLWFRVEDTEKGTGYISGEYLSLNKPVIQEPSSSVNNDSVTNNQEQSQQQGTVVNEPAPVEESLPDAPAPDNPDALESLPNGGSANVGGAVDFSQMTNGSGTGMGTDGSGPSTGMKSDRSHVVL